MPPIRRSGSHPARPNKKRVIAGRVQPPTDRRADDQSPTRGNESVSSVPTDTPDTATDKDDARTSDNATSTATTKQSKAGTASTASATQTQITGPAAADDERTSGEGSDTTVSEASALSKAGGDRADTGRRKSKGRDETSSTQAADERDHRSRWWIAASAAAIVVGVTAGTIGALSLTGHSASPLYTVGQDNAAFLDSELTEDVRQAASMAVQRLVSIDYQTLDEYHDTLGEFLSDDLIAELDNSWPTLQQTYRDTKLKVDATVSEVGVSYLQDDRAEVLLVQDVSTTRDGVAAGSTTGTYLVTMSLIDGVWKLSEIPDLPS